MSSISQFAWDVVRRFSFVGISVLLCTVVSSLAGCNDPGGSTAPRVEPLATEQAEREQMGRRLLTSASDMLNDLDNFDEGNIETALRQLIRRLNEGLATLPASADRPGPMTIEDGRILREMVWLRDTARFAVGDETDPLRRAERLFDWTIRNLQLVPAETPEAKLPFLPWHTFLLGRATELDRAWIFQLLARQQGLDVVLLAYPDPTPGIKPNQLRRWCAALLLDKQLYLFDARIGAPIRTKDGKQTATLAQATADDGLLRALDLAGKPAYPARASEIARLVAIIDVSSSYVEPRFAQFEKALGGRDKLVLSIDPAALTAQLKQCPGIVEVVAWPLRDERYAASRESEKENFAQLKALLSPYNLPRHNLRPGTVSPLLKARIRHFSGKYYENPQETDPALMNLSINRYYQGARPAEEDLAEIQLQRDAQAWALAHRIKQNATYWLGLVAYDLRNFETARSYFELVLKEKTSADWTTGARYNLGRTYEAESEAATDSTRKQALLKQAIETYRATFLDLAPDDQALERAKFIEGPAAAK
ncbi:MAG: hypothetical protein K8U03_26960 [Planctomycetia bacterium]|nr:hypothetical protein [Planctomycetia bacterium]